MYPGTSSLPVKLAAGTGQQVAAPCSHCAGSWQTPACGQAAPGNLRVPKGRDALARPACENGQRGCHLLPDAGAWRASSHSSLKLSLGAPDQGCTGPVELPWWRVSPCGAGDRMDRMRSALRRSIGPAARAGPCRRMRSSLQAARASDGSAAPAGGVMQEHGSQQGCARAEPATAAVVTEPSQAVLRTWRTAEARPPPALPAGETPRCG